MFTIFSMIGLMDIIWKQLIKQMETYYGIIHFMALAKSEEDMHSTQYFMAIPWN